MDPDRVHTVQINADSARHWRDKICTTCVTAMLNALDNRRISAVYGRGLRE